MKAKGKGREKEAKGLTRFFRLPFPPKGKRLSKRQLKERKWRMIFEEGKAKDKSKGTSKQGK